MRYLKYRLQDWSWRNLRRRNENKGDEETPSLGRLQKKEQCGCGRRRRRRGQAARREEKAMSVVRVAGGSPPRVRVEGRGGVKGRASLQQFFLLLVPLPGHLLHLIPVHGHEGGQLVRHRRQHHLRHLRRHLRVLGGQREVVGGPALRGGGGGGRYRRDWKTFFQPSGPRKILYDRLKVVGILVHCGLLPFAWTRSSSIVVQWNLDITMLVFSIILRLVAESRFHCTTNKAPCVQRKTIAFCPSSPCSLVVASAVLLPASPPSLVFLAISLAFFRASLNQFSSCFVCGGSARQRATTELYHCNLSLSLPPSLWSYPPWPRAGREAPRPSCPSLSPAASS